MDTDAIKAQAHGRWPDILRRLAPVLDDALSAGPRRHVQCPMPSKHARGDERPSFRFSDAGAGKAICTCGSYDGWSLLRELMGWDFPTAKRHVREELGMSAAPTANGNTPKKNKQRVYRSELEAIRAASHPHRLEQSWPYRSAVGEVVGHAVRSQTANGKHVKPVSRVNDGWAVQGMPAPRPLYRLPEIMDAAELHVFEGEKCVDAAASLGMHATTWAGGCNAIHQSDWSVLASKSVYLWPDNDEPGRDAMDKLTLILEQHNCHVITVGLRGLPPKGDIVDWLDTKSEAAEPDALREELMEIARAADPTPRPISITCLVEQHPRMHTPVIDGLLRAAEVANIIAAPKVGKSWLSYGLALAVVTGAEWLETYPCRQGSVLLIDNELHPPTIARRIQEVAQALGVTVSDCGGLDVVSVRGRKLDLNKLSQVLRRFKRDQYALVVLDAWYRAYPPGISENDNAGVMELYNTLDEYAAELGAAWVNVHHASKGPQGGKAVTDVGAGAGSQSRAADTHIVLRPHEKEGLIVLDAALRSFPPVEPLVLQWSYPLWHAVDGIDPRKLQGRLTAREHRQLVEDEASIGKIAGALAGGDRMTARDLRGATGMSRGRLERLLDQLESEKRVVRRPVTKRGNVCNEYSLAPLEKDVGDE